MANPMPSNVTLQALDAAVKRYPALITSLKATKKATSASHPSLEDLDTFRYDTLPAQVAARRASPAPEQAILTKADLTQLVAWKLSHGTFRPALMKHVASNHESLVTDTVRDVLGMLAPSLAKTSAAQTPQAQELVPALTALAKPLKGIGPATASLVLSVVYPDSVPFFSDELYRWCLFGEARKDWRTVEIKYNVKEYAALVDRTREIRERLRQDGLGPMPAAVDLEKAAYVWARSASGGDDKDADAEPTAEVDVQTNTKETTAIKQGSDDPAVAKKRKLTTSGGADPPRQSSRRKVH